MNRKLTLLTTLASLCTFIHAGNGKLKIRDGAPHPYIYFELESGETQTVGKHIRSAENIGRNDLLLTIRDADGAHSEVRLVKKRGSTLEFPSTQFSHTLVQVKCLSVGSFEDPAEILEGFPRARREIIRQPSAAAEKAVLEAQEKAAAEFDEYKALRQRQDAEAAIARVVSRWESIQDDAIRVRSKLTYTVEGDFPELQKAITSTEQMVFPVSDTSEAVRSQARVKRLVASLDKEVNRPEKKRKPYNVDLKRDYPEIQAMRGQEPIEPGADVTDMTKALQKFGAELAKLDRNYKGQDAVASIKNEMQKVTGSIAAIATGVGNPVSAEKAVAGARIKVISAVETIADSLSKDPASMSYVAAATSGAQALKAAATAATSAEAQVSTARSKTEEDSRRLVMNLGRLNGALNEHLTKLPTDLLVLLSSVPDAMANAVKIQNRFSTAGPELGEDALRAASSVAARVEQVRTRAGLNEKKTDYSAVRNNIANVLKTANAIDYANWEAQVHAIRRAAEAVRKASDSAADSVQPYPGTTAVKAAQAAELSKTLSALIDKAVASAKEISQNQRTLTTGLKSLTEAVQNLGMEADDYTFSPAILDGWEEPAAAARPLARRWQNAAESNRQRIRQASQRTGELLADKLEKRVETALADIGKEFAALESNLKQAIYLRNRIASQHQVNYAVNTAVDGLYPEAVEVYDLLRGFLQPSQDTLALVPEAVERGRVALNWLRATKKRALDTFETETEKLSADLETSASNVWKHKFQIIGKTATLSRLIQAETDRYGP